MFNFYMYNPFTDYYKPDIYLCDVLYVKTLVNFNYISLDI